MAVGIITGSGTYALPGFVNPTSRDVATPWGAAPGAGRRLLRTRRRPALQHADGDRPARGGGRHGRLADGRSRDGAVRRARGALRADGLRDGSRERREAR